MKNSQYYSWSIVFVCLASGLLTCAALAQEKLVQTIAPVETVAPAETAETKKAPPAESTAAPVAAQKIPIEKPLRDPFWPVGYAPAAAAAVVFIDTPDGPKPRPENLKPDWNTAEKQLSISGVVVDHTGKRPTFAIVNGAIITVGDGLTLESRRFTYIWKVKGITRENGLQLTRKRANQKN
jgi:hypothetical protein